MPKSTSKKPVRRATGVDLGSLFGAVASNLSDNRETLNKADTYNKDHGDNMVQIFQTMAQMANANKSASQSRQLASASEALRKSKSGSAQLYADNLSRASQQFKGKTITPDNAGLLLKALLGSQGTVQAPTQAASGAGDLLGSLLGGLGGQTAGNQSQTASGAGDLLGSLLGGLGGQGAGDQSGSQIDVGDLLNAGMAFMNAKQQGSSNVEALINAVISASPMGQSQHRSQSGALVANTIMQVLGGMAKK